MISDNTAKMTVYLPKVVLEAVKLRARQQNRTISNYVAWVLAGDCDLRAYSTYLNPLTTLPIKNLK